MKLNETLLMLRKQKGLTQEELSEALFVSRAAVSKWESGRGYPGIDSLMEIAKFFGVTVDDLLSGEEILTLAREETKKKENSVFDLVFGLMDCSIAMLFFLPFFRQKADGILQEVSLLSLSEIAPYLRTVYILVVAGITVLGILTLALQNCSFSFWSRFKTAASFFLSAVGALLFMIGLQPYAASFLFLLLLVKVFLRSKRL